MRLLNLLFVAATILAVGGGYVQERRRLATIRQLPPADARARFESAQRRRERVMLVVTAVLVASAIVALATRVWR